MDSFSVPYSTKSPSSDESQDSGVNEFNSDPLQDRVKTSTTAATSATTTVSKQEIYNALEQFDVQREVSNSIKHETKSKVLYLSDSDKRIVIPSNCLKHDASVFLICGVIADIIGFDLIKYEVEGDYVLKPEYDNVFHGLLQQLRAPQFVRLERSKKGYALGSAIAAALSVKSEFEALGRVQMLRKNNFFFGNNSKELTGKKKKTAVAVPFGLKDTIVSAFKQEEVGEEFYKFLRDAFRVIGMTNYSEDNYSKMVRYAFIPFDELVKSFFRKRRSKGKMTEEPVAAQKPSKTKLFTDKEFDLFMDLLDVCWNSLDLVKEEYESLIWSDPKEIFEKVKTVYSKRYTLIEKFASVTTKRLTELKNSDDTFKGYHKKDVKPDDREFLIASRDKTCGSMFALELGKIFGEELSELLQILAKNKSSPYVSSTKYLQYRISLVYSDVAEKFQIETPAPDKVQEGFYSQVDVATKAILNLRGKRNFSVVHLERILKYKTHETLIKIRRMLCPILLKLYNDLIVIKKSYGPVLEMAIAIAKSVFKLNYLSYEKFDSLENVLRSGVGCWLDGEKSLSGKEIILSPVLDEAAKLVSLLRV